MKVALVHDFLIEYGGAERVLEVLHEIWPQAPVYTAFYNPKSLGILAKKFEKWNIKVSWGTKLPFWQKLVSPYRIFSKSFFESFDLSEFDLVVSSSNMYMAKAVKVPNGVHICYCHTPPRFLWGYPTALNWRSNIFIRPIAEIMNHIMRVWDFEVAQPPAYKASEGQGRVDYFIANSKEVAARIKNFYRRDSKVIYPPVALDAQHFRAGPPVDVERFARLKTKDKRLKQNALDLSHSSLDNYFLVVSRLVGAKKVDVAVETFAKLGLPLKVVGTGKEMENLKRIAKRQTTNDKRNTVEFLGEVSDSNLIRLYQNCRAVVFPALEEDFGLVPVEAMAAGKPVIVNAQGGVLETVIDAIGAGKGLGTGVYFDPPTLGSLTVALNNFMDLEKKGYFDAKFIQNHAKKFSKERFKNEIKKFVEDKVK